MTDADVVLGRIDPARFAGGTIALDPDTADAALATGIGAPLGHAAEQAAVGVTEIVDENMANAARVHAVERGKATAERTLIAFGGAAPLHAAGSPRSSASRASSCRRTRASARPSASCAAPVAYEVVRSRYMRLDAFDADVANALFAEMEREAEGHARAAAGEPARCGEAHRLHALSRPGPRDRGGAARPHADGGGCGNVQGRVRAGIHAPFERHIPKAAIEIMTWSVLGDDRDASRRARLAARPSRAPRRQPVGRARGVRPAELGKRVTVPMYRARRPGARRAPSAGPALIVEDGTTTFVSRGFERAVDAGGALVLIGQAGQELMSRHEPTDRRSSSCRSCGTG